MIDWKNKDDDNETKKEDINKNHGHHFAGEISREVARSNPNALAAAIANVFRKEGKVELQADGTAAIN